MKNIAKKLICALLTIALVFVLFAGSPQTASAADETFFADAFNALPGITAVANTTTHTVTVTGALTTAIDVPLDIDSGVTILMKANYSGTTNNPLITLTGSGIFKVGEGGSIKNNGTGPAIYSTGANATVIIDGGTVSTASACAIGVMDGTIRINSGTVSSPIGYATVAVVAAVLGNATVEMNGGTVSCTAEGIAIGAQGPSTSVKMTGGTVTATTGAGIGAIGIGSSVTMSGGTVSATTGVAIGAYGDNSEIKVTDGTVSATTGVGIGAIGINSNVTVEGGTVSATNQAAVAVAGAGAKVTLSGGWVFAYGQDINGEGNVINMLNGGAPTISGTAVICAWNKPSGTPSYNAGDKTALTVAPTGATATWGKEGAQTGLNYANGTNKGFFPISGITVNAAANAAPTITGPTSMSLTVGYAATSTDVYTVGGTPAPEVKKTSGNAGILWNDSTKKLEIAAGLPKGTYPVALTASNGVDPEATLTFTLTVADSSTVTASGAMANFKLVNTYKSGQFSDVDENQWYGYNVQKVIARAYEYGLMQGNSQTTFNPLGNMTVAEAITIAARVRSIYKTGSENFVQGSPWYQVYVKYAIDNDIIPAAAFSDYARPATRAEMAYIFSSALPETEFAAQNTVNGLPDVNSATPYREAILMLYKAGVLTGSDDKGTFKPTDNINRAEAAAIISRLILPATRGSGKTFE